MLFNPPPQFSRLGTWCPAFVCMYVYVCVCVCVCVFGGLSGLYGGFVCGGLVGWLALGYFSSSFIASMLYKFFM